MINLLKFAYCWVRKKIYFPTCKKKINRINRQYTRIKNKLKNDLFA